METRYIRIAVGQVYEYYICTDGLIHKLTRKSGKESIMRGTLKRGAVVIKINGKHETIKTIVAHAFIPQSRVGRWVIKHIDGDPWNNAVDNLQLIPQREYSRITGPMATSQRIEVITPEGKRKVYSSIRKAAKDMFVSYQTILDYMNNEYKSSVLDGYSFRKIN